ncbi:hypothetical protein OB959_16975 [Aeromonas bestiarum]|uniref:Uncharacterized protein n=1 Tax=Aeromonas bestiarum TaxID=105751 RepID=A0AAW7IC79_9GAMM|nr:hypothetical protein [Aeromonas bestiarum]MDM5141467.1 hypothetical protein [Aeromonas bestiarum]
MKHRLKLHIIMMLLLPSISLANQNDQLPIGNFELNIGARPSAPYPAMSNYNTDLTSQGSGSGYPVEVSRHHIIPFNVLRNFYNRIAERNQFSNVGGFFNTYANNLPFYASTNGINCNNLGSDLVDAGNLALAQRYSLARRGGTAMAPGFDTFEQFYTWLPGNLFIGPSNRSDDPGEGFESDAHVVVGDEYFDTLARAHRNMQRFNNGDDDPNLLNAITVDLTKIAKRRSIFSLRSQDWEYVNGKYRLRTPKFNEKGRITQPLETPRYRSDTCETMTATLLETLTAIL